MTLFIFDFDGVLIDSEQLIRESYREAGVEPPENFMSLGHHDWIVPEDRERVHARKNCAYLRRIRSGPFSILPPWKTAEMLQEAGQLVTVMTGAPMGTKWSLVNHDVSWPFTEFWEDRSPTRKAAFLKRCSRAVVYVDDQEYVKIPPGCKFVKYTDQSAAQLFREVTE